jgi:hypothetical protein
LPSLPIATSQTLQNNTPSQQDYLLADLTAALAACQGAVGRNIRKNDAQAWNCYLEYCNHIGFGHNLFLDKNSQQERIKIMGAFAVAVHQGQFWLHCHALLAESTVASTINAVAAIFRENGHDNLPKNAEKTLADFYANN